MIESTGDIVSLKTTNQKHFGVKKAKAEPGDFMEKFGEAVKDAITDANDLMVTSDKKTTQMISKPDSINVHDVMIAAQKAQLALEYTKSVLTKAVQAYQNITNLR